MFLVSIILTVATEKIQGRNYKFLANEHSAALVYMVTNHNIVQDGLVRRIVIWHVDTGLSGLLRFFIGGCNSPSIIAGTPRKIMKFHFYPSIKLIRINESISPILIGKSVWGPNDAIRIGEFVSPCWNPTCNFRVISTTL